MICDIAYLCLKSLALANGLGEESPCCYGKSPHVPKDNILLSTSTPQEIYIAMANETILEEKNGTPAYLVHHNTVF